MTDESDQLREENEKLREEVEELRGQLHALESQDEPSGETDSDGSSRIGSVYLSGGPVWLDEIQQHLSDEKLEQHPLARLVTEALSLRKRTLSPLIERFVDPPTIQLEKYRIQPDVLELIPEKTVKQYGVLPIAQIGPVLCLTQFSPFEEEAFRAVHRHTGLKVFPMESTPDALKDALQQYYNLSNDDLRAFIDLPEAPEPAATAPEESTPEEASERLKPVPATAPAGPSPEQIREEWEQVARGDTPLRPEPVSLNGR